MLDNNNFWYPRARHLTLSCLLINTRWLCTCCRTFAFVFRWESEKFNRGPPLSEREQLWQCQHVFKTIWHDLLIGGTVKAHELTNAKIKKMLLGFSQILRWVIYPIYQLYFYVTPSIVICLFSRWRHHLENILFLYCADYFDGCSAIKIGVIAHHLL